MTLNYTNTYNSRENPAEWRVSNRYIKKFQAVLTVDN